MNTTIPTTGDTQSFRSPLRVTSEAVELRDRSYPLGEVRSAQVVKVRADSLGLRLGIMAMFYFLGTALVLLVRYFVQISQNGAPLFQLPSGYSAFTANSDSTLRTTFFVFVIAGLLGLYVLSRVRSIKGRYLYAANLRSPFWSTIIAASRDEQPVVQVVASVNMALKEKAGGIQAAPSQTQGSEPEVYYESDNAVTVDDNWVELPGKSYPLASLHFATAYPVVGQSIRDTFINSGVIGGVLGVLNGLTSDPQVRGVPWEPWVLYLLAGIAISAFQFLINKRKGGPLAIIHVCWLRTAKEDFVAFTSIDRGYTEQVVRAINQAVRDRDNRAQRMSRMAET